MANIIFAPHIDDELVGCFSLLQAREVHKVFYFYELSDQRREEAQCCADIFGFQPLFLASENIEVYDNFDPADTVYCPHIKDNHPAHKFVNQLSKGLTLSCLKYYSVDMNTRDLKVLSTSDQQIKLNYLSTIFPSQKRLWENEKYWLFESISETDLETQIYINTQFEGVHAYPAAPAGVEFLAHPHRHIFHVNIKIDVFHNDRELEFILFKREMNQFIADNLKELQFKSCEMIGEMFLTYIISKYKRRSCSVTISEDLENGAEVKYVY